MADYVDEMLAREEKRTKGNLSDVRQMQGSVPLPRPGIGALFTMPVQSTAPTVPSKAPYKSYGTMPIPDDIGAMRQAESQKVTRKKLGGRSISNPLSYRMPETAIDAKYGPKDKIC